MYRHLLWDFDGTLFDAYPALTKAFLQALAVYGVQESEQTVHSLLKVSMGHAIAYYREQGCIDEQFRSVFREKQTVTEQALLTLYPYAKDICAAAVQVGGSNFLVTHRSNVSAVAHLKRFDLYRYFTDFTTSDSGFVRKPDPAAVLYLLEKHKLPPEHTVMIGDRELDILAGKNAGIATCFFDPDQTGQPTVAEHRVTTLCELLPLIKKHSPKLYPLDIDF